MPFVKRAKFSFSNEGEKAVPLFYQVDYTIGDKLRDVLVRADTQRAAAGNARRRGPDRGPLERVT